MGKDATTHAKIRFYQTVIVKEVRYYNSQECRLNVLWHDLTTACAGIVTYETLSSFRNRVKPILELAATFVNLEPFPRSGVVKVQKIR